LLPRLLLHRPPTTNHSLRRKPLEDEELLSRTIKLPQEVLIAELSPLSQFLMSMSLLRMRMRPMKELVPIVISLQKEIASQLDTLRARMVL